MKARSLATFILLLAAVLYLEWQWLPPLPVVESAAPPDDPWQLPQLHRPDIAAAHKALTTLAPWGSINAGLASGPQPDPRWSLAGTMHRGGERYLLVKFEGQPTRQLGVGDSLPGDNKILEIRHDTVCVLVNRQRRLLRVFER